MSASDHDLSNALADVRRAYRILHAYHRRLNDLLYRIHEQVSNRGLAFEFWAPINVSTLPKSKDPFFAPGIWAWDLTPAYQIQCAWSSPHRDGKISRIGVSSVADTGYNYAAEGEPNPAFFEDAANCATEFSVAGWTSTAKNPRWLKAWKSLAERPSIANGKVHAVEVDDERYTYILLRTVDVSILNTGDMVAKHITEPIDRWLKTQP